MSLKYEKSLTDVLIESVLSVTGYLYLGSYTGEDWSPLDLFAAGEQGAWCDPSDLTTLYQDAAGTTPVTSDGDPVGLMEDKSGNNSNVTQSVSASRSVYQETPDRLVFDKVDDNMTVDFTGSGGFNATLLQASEEGIVHAEVIIPDGTWDFTQIATYFPSDNITGMILNEGVMSASDLAEAKQYLIDNGSAGDFAGVTSMQIWFRGRSDIANLYLDDYNTQNVTTFNRFITQCTNISSIDVSPLDMSAATSFRYFAFGCINLTTVTLGDGGEPFASSSCIDYAQSFASTNLSQQSIDDILVAINTAGTSNGTFDQSGGSAPSTTGEAAIDALRVRGWTITVTGGY